MECLKRLWKLEALLAIAVTLIITSFISPDPNSNRHLAQLISAVALFALTVLPLVVECYFISKAERNDITASFSLLSVTIYFFILLGGACFTLWGEWMPYAVLAILVVMYLFTVLWFFGYLFGWWEKTYLGNWDILKGFGGTTFAEFAGGVGILVSIGIYLVYTTSNSDFWWAAQFAALFSLISAAAWVQRYVLEPPQFPENAKGKNDLNHFMRTGPNFLSSLAVICTMLAVSFPTQTNRDGLEAALGEDRWWIHAAWMMVILFWLAAAAVPLIKRNWPANPLNRLNYPSEGSRKAVRLFLVLVLIALVVTTTFVIFSFVWTGSPLSEDWSKWAAIIASGLFVLGITTRWVVDNYKEEADSELKMLMIFRDIALLGCGSVIFIVQISGVGDPASPLSTLYKFILGMMAYSTLIGILIGAYKWSYKRQTRQTISNRRRANTW